MLEERDGLGLPIAVPIASLTLRPAKGARLRHGTDRRGVAVHPPHLGVEIFTFPLLIGLSCLFTKQHFVIDVPFGLALGWATYELFLMMI